MTINKKLRYNRQSDFNLSRDRFNEYVFNDKKYLVYDNANLSLMLSDKCNADCNFCIAHLRYLVDNNTYIKPKLNNLEKYLSTFKDYWESHLKKINPSVSITGGEPSIHKDIIPVIEMLNTLQPRKQTMTTNATGLVSNNMLLNSLITANFDYLNISRAHWDKKQNDKLMKMNTSFIKDEELYDIIQTAKLAGVRPRLSCSLLKSGVSNIQELKSYADWAIDLGIDNVIFRQLMQFDAERIKPGRIPNFCIKNEIDLIPLWEQMDNDKDFELYHQVLGYYYYVEVYKYKGIDLVSESADLRLIDSQIKHYSDKFKQPTLFELVYHPNGTLGGSWREFERVLLG